MGAPIGSANKPLSVALHQKHAIIFIEMLLIKCQIFILNLNMPKTKWVVVINVTMFKQYIELSCIAELHLCHWFGNIKSNHGKWVPICHALHVHVYPFYFLVCFRIKPRIVSFSVHAGNFDTWDAGRTLITGKRRVNRYLIVYQKWRNWTHQTAEWGHSYRGLKGH